MGRFKSPHPVFMGLSILGVTVAAPLPAQESHTHSPTLMVLVDGAREPEKIPDSLAYSHFILSVAEPDEPSTEQLKRRTAMLSPVQLSKADQLALIAALRGVRKQIDSIQGEAKRLSSSSVSALSRLDDLRLQRTRVLDDAMARVSGGLSEDGAARLDMYIKAEVRPKIVIYGSRNE